MLDRPSLTFGRSVECDCRLPHRTVSREHFKIERTLGRYFVIDSESINGTFLNGERITWAELRNGDSIHAGPFKMAFDITGKGLSVRGAESAESEQVAEDPGVYPRQYTEGIEHFNNRRYFEAHEVWEEIWLRSSGTARLFYQMLIQSAVSLHHRARDNRRGATGMYRRVIEKLDQLPEIYCSLDLVDFGVQYRAFFRDLIDGSGPPGPVPVIRLISEKQ